jgi:hypothetical protein
MSPGQEDDYINHRISIIISSFNIKAFVPPTNQQDLDMQLYNLQT